MNIKKLLSTLSLAALLTSASTIPSVAEISGHIPGSPLPPDCVRWVDSVYNSLSERERVAQLVFPKIAPDQPEKARAAVRRMVAENRVGGLLFSKGSLEQYASIINYAQSLAQVPLMITFDGEWGLSMRIPGTTRFPKNMALGALSDPRLLYDYGREMARQAHLVGVNVNFAPVLDVNSNPANPVIGIRSYGSDPARVAELGTAYSLGLEDGGVMAVGKHFPGHGDTSTDSHKARTVVSHSAAQLDSVDLVPFRSFIQAGCSGIMTGHIVLPALNNSGIPASLSPAVSTHLLRNSLGFNGLVFTDALEMKGAHIEGQNNAVLALAAGADVLETPQNAPADIDAILAAVASGRLPKERVEESCRRLLAYKYLLGLNVRPQKINAPELPSLINTPQAEALNRALTAATITVVRNSAHILPLHNLQGKKIALVNIGTAPGNVFSSFCSRYATASVFSCTESQPLTAAQLHSIASADVVITAVFSQKAFARETFAKLKSHQSLVSVFFTSPYAITSFAPDLTPSQALVVAYEDTPLAQEYAAQAIFGGIHVSGRLPVEIPKVAPLGAGVKLAKTRLGYSSPLQQGLAQWLPDSLNSRIAQLLAQKATPGCQLLVARHGNIVYNRSFGHTTTGGPAVTDSTVYDLASVSKAVGTLAGLMKAYDMGLYRLDDFMSTHIPQLMLPGKDSLRVREFLFHETAFPASLDMYAAMIDSASFTGRLVTSRRDKNHTIRIGRNAYGHNSARLRHELVSKQRSIAFPTQAAKGLFIGPVTADTLMNRIYNIPLRKNKDYNYSCLNFCTLLDMEQRLTGIPHHRFVADSIFGPLGAETTCYRAADTLPQKQIAPTERDNFFRRQLLHGYVHDELAAFLGGVSGNAGLFSNATDIAKFSQMLLNGGTYGSHRFYSEPTTRLFMQTKSPTCRRGLGFDKPNTSDPSRSPTCEEAHPSVIGHTGFTGTAFWIDPANDLIFVFLTNRVNPSRDNRAFSQSNIRSELFRLVYQALNTPTL